MNWKYYRKFSTASEPFKQFITLSEFLSVLYLFKIKNNFIYALSDYPKTYCFSISLLFVWHGKTTNLQYSIISLVRNCETISQRSGTIVKSSISKRIRTTNLTVQEVQLKI